MGSDRTKDHPHPHSSAYHGLASIAIAGVFLLMAMPALRLANTLQQSNYGGFNGAERQASAIAGYAGAGDVILLSLVAAGTAIVGVKQAGRTGEPAILSVAGLLLSLLAALVRVGCVVAWHSQAWRHLWAG